VIHKIINQQLTQKHVKRRKGTQKMKKLVLAILTIAMIAAISAGIVLAQKPEAESAEKYEAQMVSRGRGRMMGMGGLNPMMRRGGMMGNLRSGDGMGRMGVMSLLTDELKLSDDQKAKLEEMHTAHRKDMIKSNADLQIARVDLQNLMRQDNPNLDSIHEQLQKIANLEAEMQFSQIKATVEAKNILTDEQKTALKKMREDRQGQGKQQMKPGREERRGSKRPPAKKMRP